MKESSLSPQESLKHIFKGYPLLHQYIESQKLNQFQKMQLSAALATIYVYRKFIQTIGKDEEYEEDLQNQLRDFENMSFEARGTKRKETHQNFYLSEQEVESFNRDGIIGPIELMSPKEALQIGKAARKKHNDGEFEKHSFLSSDIIKAYKNDKSWSINYSGFYQALRVPEYWELLSCPQLVQPLASLLGNDVICWRSQFFGKDPKTPGTFWHQNSVFRETSKLNKLLPTKDISPGVASLTTWIALSEATINHGAMRFMLGTANDGRIERLYSYVLDNKIRFLALQGEKVWEDFLKVVLYSNGLFHKAQAVFTLALDYMGDFFNDKKITDYPLKPGECILFSSLLMHGAHPNTTDDHRLALGGRFTTNDVKVFPDMEWDNFTTPKGNKKYSLDKIGSFQVHGKDEYHYNKIYSSPGRLQTLTHI